MIATDTYRFLRIPADRFWNRSAVGASHTSNVHLCELELVVLQLTCGCFRCVFERLGGGDAGRENATNNTTAQIIRLEGRWPSIDQVQHCRPSLKDTKKGHPKRKQCEGGNTCEEFLRSGISKIVEQRIPSDVSTFP